jgi:hypothetical protein
VPTTDRLRDYTADPLACIEDLQIPGVRGRVRFGDAMADFQRKRFASLAPSLLAIVRGTKPPIGRFWHEATKGGSKDSDLACNLLWLLSFTRRPLSCQVGAADADQANELKKAAADILRLNPWLAQRVAVQNWKLICSATDSVAEIVPADVAGSHGARPDVLILNELSHVTREEFASNMMDNAAKVPNGLAIIATNAGFQDSWQARWREIARTSPRWNFHQWAEPAPWLDPAEIEEAKQRNSLSRYLRLFHGRWASGSGDAIDVEDLEAAITMPGPMHRHPPAAENWTFVAGMDLGVKRDASALVVLGARYGSPRIRLAHCESWIPGSGRNVDLESVYRAVLRAHAIFRFSLWFDPSQALHMAQRLQRRNVICNEQPFIGQHLDRMASTLLQTFRARTIDLFNDSALIRDLGRLNIEEKSFGYKLSASREVDGHADRGIALAICLPHAVELSHRRAFDYSPPQALNIVHPVPKSMQLDSRSRDRARDPHREGWTRH